MGTDVPGTHTQLAMREIQNRINYSATSRKNPLFPISGRLCIVTGCLVTMNVILGNLNPKNSASRGSLLHAQYIRPRSDNSSREAKQDLA